MIVIANVIIKKYYKISKLEEKISVIISKWCDFVPEKSKGLIFLNYKSKKKWGCQVDIQKSIIIFVNNIWLGNRLKNYL